eukprot:comp18856_c0_seq1/m.20901 comp18856_c0_seq1/g.20901  ORF comp18856_c0_seq1/g.20901 comp18856_c0_seq1/m.20901 type:complete len:429 (-) comp18856_c0_seq1:234-1520(-)
MASIFRLVSLLAVYGCPSWGKLATMGVPAGGRIQQVASLTLTEKGEDPEVHMDVEQMIVSKGYPYEFHQVQTPDGFLLGVQRIPHGLSNKSPSNSRPVAFLQHGLLGSASNWLDNPANESLGYILADAGYDVWLGNVRGSNYSRAHVTLDPRQREFWDWSFDEMSLIDLPAMVEYARRVSGQEKLYYIGHSQGTLMGFAGLSSNQTLAKMVHAMFALAPVGEVGHIRGPLKFISQILPPRMVGGLLDALGTGELWPSGSTTQMLAGKYCQSRPEICENFLFLVAGHDTTHFNISRLPVYLAHNPAGTSVRNIVHWAQCVRSNNFQMYDYGLSGNQQHYGQSTPPLYNPSEVTVPVALFTAKGDYLADPTDIIWLREQLSHVLIYEQDMPDWEHLDFIWSPDAATTIYPAIIDLMQKHRNGIPLSPLVH